MEPNKTHSSSDRSACVASGPDDELSAAAKELGAPSCDSLLCLSDELGVHGSRVVGPDCVSLLPLLLSSKKSSKCPFLFSKNSEPELFEVVEPEWSDIERIFA
mmetsp:Transcript_2939/g.6738  ORF Transcript_2939/g.6738 Transcript_2939/m.6738 type:complete len:103 (-) Transcript_2939:29-337(-)